MAMQTFHAIAACPVNAKILDSLIASVRFGVLDTFQTICGTVDACQELPYQEYHDGLIGMISFAGDFAWSLELRLSEISAVEVTRVFTGMEIASDSEDMGGAIAELINIIAGPICAQLEAQNIKAQMSLPVVAKSKGFEILHPYSLQNSDLHFNLKGSPFKMKVVAALAS